MIEVEVKLPVKDSSSIRKKLAELGFKKEESLCEQDIYFDNADHRIRGRGEALRVREIRNLNTGKAEACITFKGQKLDTVSMSRRELETKVKSASVCIELLKAIGYNPVMPQVKKNRENFRKEDISACLDQVDHLGDFLELEIIIPEEENRNTALERIRVLLQILGYSLEDTTRTSYLSMLQGVSDD